MNTTNVVIYTPAQNFLYNTDAGATFTVFIFFLIAAVVAGFFAELGVRTENRFGFKGSTVLTKAVGSAVALGTFLALWHFFA